MEKSKKRITAKIKDTIERILKDAKVLREDMESLYKIPDNRKAPGVYASKNDVKAIYCGGQDISLVCKGSEKISSAARN